MSMYKFTKQNESTYVLFESMLRLQMQISQTKPPKGLWVGAIHKSASRSIMSSVRVNKVRRHRFAEVLSKWYTCQISRSSHRHTSCKRRVHPCFPVRACTPCARRQKHTSTQRLLFRLAHQSRSLNVVCSIIWPKYISQHDRTSASSTLRASKPL